MDMLKKKMKKGLYATPLNQRLVCSRVIYVFIFVRHHVPVSMSVSFAFGIKGTRNPKRKVCLAHERTL